MKELNTYGVRLLLFLIIIILPERIFSCERDRSIILDLYAENQTDITLDQFDVTNKQLDSVLYKIAQNIQPEANVYFYITFMKSENNLYFEIIEDFSNDYLFEIDKKEDTVYKGKNHKIYGCSKYNHLDFYLLLYPNADYHPDEESLGKFFSKREEKIIVKRKSAEFVFIWENPMWLYQYTDGDLKLVKYPYEKEFSGNL